MNTSDYNVVSLSTILETSGDVVALNLLQTFSPFKDSEAGDFLSEKAITMEKRDLSRTFLAVEKSSDTILGFYTLGLKCIHIPDDSCFPNNVLKMCNIEPSTQMAQAYLLGQLARSSSSPKGFGDVLIESAKTKLKESKKNVGCRMLRLDCTDELVSYYSKHGFIKIRKNEDKDLNQIMVFI